jgi:hypothetical protein
MTANALELSAKGGRNVRGGVEFGLGIMYRTVKQIACKVKPVRAPQGGGQSQVV